MPERARPRHGRRFRSRSSTRRAPILAVVAVLLVGGGLLDRIAGPSGAPQAGAVEPVPVAARANALSSSWFCAGAADGRSNIAPGAVVVTNAGASAVKGVLTLVPSNGRALRREFAVGPDSTVSLAEKVPKGAPWIGGIVDVDGGDVAVDQLIQGILGRSLAPCATSGSTRWYFASGQTLVNADVELSLLNPYPTNCIVDLSFSTNEGPEQPQDFQGIDVPPEGMLAVDLGSHLRRRTNIAATIAARSCDVVAWETRWVTAPHSGQVLLGTAAAHNPLADPAAPIPGVEVVLGAASTGRSWTWPDGLTGDGLTERYVIFDPGPNPAQVQLSVGLAQGSAEPFNLSVGADQVVDVVSGQQARIPAGVPHSAVLESLNGVGVVAERLISASGAGRGGLLSATGLGVLGGAQVAAPTWLIPETLLHAGDQGALILYNPATTSIDVRIDTVAQGSESPMPGRNLVALGPGQRAEVDLRGVHLLHQALLVSGSGPLVAEFDLYGRVGVSLSLGVPLSS